MKYETITLTVAYETYGLNDSALDAVLYVLEEAGHSELVVLDYASDELVLTPKPEGAMSQQ